jgi:hypothetical protein
MGHWILPQCERKWLLLYVDISHALLLMKMSKFLLWGITLGLFWLQVFASGPEMCRKFMQTLCSILNC